MSSVQVNYPSTTFHLEDPSANYVEVSPLNVKVASSNIAVPENVVITYDLIDVQANAPNRATRIMPMNITCQDNAIQNFLSTADGLVLYDGTIGKSVSLKHTGLKSTFASMDISCNALTLEGVSSSVGQVVMADASGAPYWANLPAPPATPSLAEVLAVSPAGVADEGQTISGLASLSVLDATNTATITGTNIHIENNVDAGLNANLTTATLQLQNGINQSVLTANYGLDMVDASVGFHTELKPAQLRSDVASFDLSFNALTLGGVSSSVNQVVMADASGAPYWASLPAEVIPTLAQVLGAGADASFNTITSIGGLELQVSQDPLVSPVVVSSDVDGALVISSATPANLVDATLATKQFSGSYLKVVLNGAECYLQIFSAV